MITQVKALGIDMLDYKETQQRHAKCCGKISCERRKIKHFDRV